MMPELINKFHTAVMVKQLTSELARITVSFHNLVNALAKFLESK